MKLTNLKLILTTTLMTIASITLLVACSNPNGPVVDTPMTNSEQEPVIVESVVAEPVIVEPVEVILPVDESLITDSNNPLVTEPTDDEMDVEETDYVLTS